ncbi:transglycosylase SLT domain-containing protein [Dactylosporangium sp. CA-092794]|uniref:transglycosylase SLT domain-containing protein n=1 Tax=Dactylosporangium sp. CA-092794 TaxID=3239929 RepID=UPI003D901B67
MSYGYSEDDDTAEFEVPRRKRPVGAILLSVGVAVVLLGCGAIITLMKGSDRDRQATAAESPDSWSTPIASVSPPSEAPLAVVTTSPAAESSAPPTKKPSPGKTTKKPSPKVTETVQPPAPPHTTQPGCMPSRGPNQLPAATVRGYLDTAATTHFWGTRTDPDYEQILVPQRLLYAIAEQESGWQSDIKACDGGLGIMQVMPDTQTFVNNRFATTWDRTKPNQNVMLGANYLAWLIAYFGPKLGTYDMSDPKLLRAVISAYNWGTAGVDYAGGVYPNPTYVQNVVALMDHSRAGNY